MQTTHRPILCPPRPNQTGRPSNSPAPKVQYVETFTCKQHTDQFSAPPAPTKQGDRPIPRPLRDIYMQTTHRPILCPPPAPTKQGDHPIPRPLRDIYMQTTHRPIMCLPPPPHTHQTGRPSNSPAPKVQYVETFTCKQHTGCKVGPSLHVMLCLVV